MGTTREQFATCWREEHLPIIMELPGLVDASLWLSVADDGQYDGLGVLCFRSLEDLTAALETPVAARLRAHTASFAESDRAIRLVVTDEWG